MAFRRFDPTHPELRGRLRPDLKGKAWRAWLYTPEGRRKLTAERRKLSNRLTKESAERQATRKRIARERRAEDTTRRDLLRGARVARGMGFCVKASKARTGTVSSYYVSRDLTSSRIRISDHDIPMNWDREMRTGGTFDGGADIYAGPELHEIAWWRDQIEAALPKAAS